MITVRDDTGEKEIHLPEVSDLAHIRDAALRLTSHIAERYRYHGVTMIRPGTLPDYPDSYGVAWEDGPRQWADAYVVSEGACGKTYTADAVGGHTVIFTNLDS